MINFSHTDIEEALIDSVARRNAAVEISEAEFGESVGLKLWESFKFECCGRGNEARAFYKSTLKDSVCFYVDAGNIDRVFLPLNSTIN